MLLPLGGHIEVNELPEEACIREANHYHIDLSYYATTDSYYADPLEGESNLLYWYTKEELSKVKNAPQDVIVMATEALELLSKI